MKKFSIRDLNLGCEHESQDHYLWATPNMLNLC